MTYEPFDLTFGSDVENLIKKFQRQNIKLEFTFIAENCVGKQDSLTREFVFINEDINDCGDLYDADTCLYTPKVSGGSRRRRHLPDNQITEECIRTMDPI